MTTQMKPAKTRSPNYPAISLEEAIQRLKTIYEKQQRYPAAREVLAQIMGYKGLNGASAAVVSALSKYGLLEGYGETLRVSELGQELALHRKGDKEYTQALRTAASMPAFFQELRDQYPSGLPHDHSLRAALIKRGFNPKAIDGAVRSYRDTMDFVEAETGNLVLDTEEEERPTIKRSFQNNETGTPVDQEPPPGQRAVAIPLSPTEWVTLLASFPLTDAAWDQMFVVLNAMKPGLVISAETQPKPSDVASSSSDPAEAEGD